MGLIYLHHPVHGAKVAICEEEANFDAENGWVRYTATTQTETPEVAALEKPAKRPYRRKELSGEGGL